MHASLLLCVHWLKPKAQGKVSKAKGQQTTEIKRYDQKTAFFQAFMITLAFLCVLRSEVTHCHKLHK
ncbi:hypothetical protein ACT691_18710 [Vibrio metschnikovii]